MISPSVKSAAEARIHRRLKLVGGDWSFALHSLNLPEHGWKRVSEIDFVVAGRRGVYVLEVKGGRVSCTNGIWTHTDRAGTQRRRRESPFAQASSAMFTLQRRIEDRLGREAMRRVTIGYAVVFPDCQLPDQTPVEWDDENLIDRRLLDRTDGLHRGLNRMADYWRAKPGGRQATLEEPLLREILQALRPDFDAVPTLRQIVTDAEADLVALTAGQYRTLDSVEHNPRLLVEGGAGTGKTMLAAELCRRSAADGKRTLFTCRSQVVAGFVRHQPGMQDVHVVPFANLPPGTDGAFDVVVVDEAQDIVNFTDLSYLDSRIAGGLTDGSWYLLLDSNNQRGLVGSCDDEALDYLRSLRPAELRLRDNCRNTRQIVTSTQRMTGADTGVSAAGEGPEVMVVHEPDRARRAAAAATELDRLHENGIPASEIILLSPLPLQESLFADLPARWRHRVDVLDLHTLRRPTRGRIAFARVEDFKGLENRFVLLADVGPVDPRHNRSLYVGMTRARVGLWLATAQRTPQREDHR
ncbi:nuclease-related domain-containing DEAD/DEAH box helicase [Micromonospora nigra]|uniref:nuclease-related domain-containing DEAD/DEAH box helicase n=1 Tax=Micromonospora nigra TaxID=145857 RepID=UPI001FDFCC9A|nr:NERD domain-containing protein/DEAD/DEAH box helicase [Micromonospora nigra]